MNTYSVFVAHGGAKTSWNSYERTVQPNQCFQPGRHQPMRKSEMAPFWHCDVECRRFGIDGFLSNHRWLEWRKPNRSLASSSHQFRVGTRHVQSGHRHNLCFVVVPNQISAARRVGSMVCHVDSYCAVNLVESVLKVSAWSSDGPRPHHDGWRYSRATNASHEIKLIFGTVVACDCWSYFCLQELVCLAAGCEHHWHNLQVQRLQIQHLKQSRWMLNLKYPIQMICQFD